LSAPGAAQTRKERAMPGESPVRLLIVDDHDILRYGLRALMRGHGEIEVVGEADGVDSAIRQARELAPDVVLMDAELGDGSGIDACREILSRDPSIRVLFFSAHSDEETVLMTVLAGAAGHVAKDLQLESLFDAILAVSRGAEVFDARVRDQVMAAIGRQMQDPARGEPEREPLSPQEERVMALVVEGKTNKEIGAELRLSDKTVKNYLSNVFQKLGVGRRGQAAALFRMQGPRPRRSPGR
jgi:two-component system, NarL family, response regulator DevR